MNGYEHNVVFMDGNDRPLKRNKYIPLCFNITCVSRGKKLGHKIYKRLGGGILKPNVSKNVTMCPDCTHGLKWVKEPQEGDFRYGNEKN